MIKLVWNLIKNNFIRIISKIVFINIPLVFTLLQLAEGIIISSFKLNANISNNIYIYLLIGVILFIYEIAIILIRIRNRTFQVKDESIIGVTIGNYIKNIEKHDDAICIFGVDDRFIMDYCYAVKDSIYCNFLEKYYSSDEQKRYIQNEVDKYILNNYGIDNRDKTELERIQLPHGSIVNLKLNIGEEGNSKLRNFIMIACATASKDRAARMQDFNIDYNLEVWNFIENNILYERTLLFPLIGTGTARGVYSHNDVSKQLVDLFFNNLDKKNINKFIISISYKDYLDRYKNVNLNDIYNYINSKITIYKSNHRNKSDDIKKIA